MKLIKVVVTSIKENTYIYYNENTKEGIIIDPGGESQKIIDCIQNNNIDIKKILLTHGHFDHIEAVSDVKTHTNALLYCHRLENEIIKNSNLNLSKKLYKKEIEIYADKLLEDKDIINFSDTSLKVIHTPGHTKGGVCYYDELNKKLFTGDTLFKNSIGRTDFVGGDYETLIESINNKIKILPDDVLILPGHGDSSTISEEKLLNEFLM